MYYILLEKNLIDRNEFTTKAARQHDEILKLRFDSERSKLEDMPSHIRKPLFQILNKYANGAVKRVDNHWIDIALNDAFLTETKYKFDE